MSGCVWEWECEWVSVPGLKCISEAIKSCQVARESKTKEVKLHWEFGLGFHKIIICCQEMYRHFHYLLGKNCQDMAFGN